MNVSEDQFSKWCESRFSEFGGAKRKAVSYASNFGLTEADVAVIRKIAGLASATMKPNKTTLEDRKAMLDERRAGHTIRLIAEKHNISASACHRIIKRMEVEE